ncbi:MAG: cation diffusion facilitator family transporter [Acidobacteria bacterium]|nr:cation diffusion facilitator family transporter [Acidobacteriota bacterium]MCA1608876.1 cation diffusion facilitator family transporter [Acidobacteriota bacterium]
MERRDLTKFAWLSIFAAVLTIGLKFSAFWLTGSVGLLSDALESLINLAAAVIALLLLRLSLRPPDHDHAFGHDKAEYFASGIEGALIIVAAVGIAWAAAARLVAPQPLEQVGIAVIISSVAAVINLIVGLILIRTGRRHDSITLEADGKHLITDVFTTAGVIVAVGLVSVTGWLFLDPLVGLLVAANIVWTGVQLMRRSALGLMDTAVSPRQHSLIVSVLDRYSSERKIDYHALRTRRSAARTFISVHILVPGRWTVHEGHNLLEKIEADIRAQISGAVVFTHLESLDDPASWDDIELDREF